MDRETLIKKLSIIAIAPTLGVPVNAGEMASQSIDSDATMIELRTALEQYDRGDLVEQSTCRD